MHHNRRQEHVPEDRVRRLYRVRGRRRDELGQRSDVGDTERVNDNETSGMII